jgi:hypothetical protein
MPSDGMISFSEVSPIGLEPVRPHVRSCFAIDQLHIDLRPVARSPYATFEDVAHA